MEEGISSGTSVSAKFEQSTVSVPASYVQPASLIVAVERRQFGCVCARGPGTRIQSVVRVRAGGTTVWGIRRCQDGRMFGGFQDTSRHDK